MLTSVLIVNAQNITTINDEEYNQSSENQTVKSTYESSLDMESKKNQSDNYYSSVEQEGVLIDILPRIAPRRFECKECEKMYKGDCKQIINCVLKNK